MAIKAFIPSGKDAITVSGLYQWDYGQVLEIESADMGSEVVEVHFACTSMSEAIVRPCTFTNGVGTVTIPDDCLEQASAITAWIYEIEGTQGKTRKVITLPVIARTRPSVARDIPQEISNRYTELITEVNEAVDALESGNVTVKRAESAALADNATTAGNASSANYAVSAGSASVATHLARNEDYVLYEEDEVIPTIRGGILSFQIETFDELFDPQGVANVIVEVCRDSYSPVFVLPFYTPKGGLVETFCRLRFDTSTTPGDYYVYLETIEDDVTNITATTYRTIRYKYLSEKYPVG